MIDFTELPDGWIRYQSQDGPVEAWQVGLYAARKNGLLMPQQAQCVSCRKVILEQGQIVHLVDSLERGTRAGVLHSWDSALVYADEVSRHDGDPLLRRWKCAQYDHEIATGQPWQPFRPWAENELEPSNSPTEMRL